ncbi:MAG: deoxyribonuclease IV [Actinomycetes bacterium]
MPVSGGLATKGLAYASAIGAEVVQVFVTNPRGWAPVPGDPAEDAAFRAAVEKGLAAFVHASYLVNFASPDPQVVDRSGGSVRHTLSRAATVGARAVVVHTGSSVQSHRAEDALRSTRESLLPLLDLGSQLGVQVLVEPMAGQGQSLCSTLDEIDAYLTFVGPHDGLGVCIDTCHVHAAGHDLAARGGMTRFLNRLGAVLGDVPLGLVHANDSMDVVGARKDRHQVIGQGHIGERPFATLLRHDLVRTAAVVLETPGDRTAHANEVARLKRLRGP